MAEFAGDYDLQYVHIRNHRGEGLQDTDGENISDMVVELNIYEGLYNHAMTGSLVIADTRNLISNLPIQGTERLSFRLATKLDSYSHEDSIDFTEATGNPMHVYKLTNKEQPNDTTQTYTLHFCSREFLRNMRTKVSKSYTGRMDEAVNSIFKDSEYLDSKKKLFFQKTRNQDKVVIPNMTPIDAIKMLGKRSLPSNVNNSGGAGYLFYETTKGFHFRSWESLCEDKNGGLIDSKIRLQYTQQNVDTQDKQKNPGPHKEEDVLMKGYSAIRSYEFKSNIHDVAVNTAKGTYGHRVITHNIYDKTYRKDDYHYHNSFNDTGHVGFMPSVVESPVDYDQIEGTPYQKGVSDYPEARVSLQATTRFAHGEDTGSYGTPVEDDGTLEGIRIAQKNKIEGGTKVEITVNGQSWLQAGDVIDFALQSIENRDNISGSKLDPQHSGRYIITDIRHRVAQERYIQVLTCIKDSVSNGYDAAGKSYAEIAGEPTVEGIYDIDEHTKTYETTPNQSGAWYPGGTY
jgi:hypothetical protein